MRPEDMRLRFYGDPILRMKARHVESFDAELERQAEKMFEIMYENEGLGLAGNQVGLLLRLIVLDVPLDEENRFISALANPVILERLGGEEVAEEGCLSIPEVRAEVSRFDALRVEALSLKGEKRTFEARGLLARAIQHEIDHLDGVLFIDRLSSVKRKLLEGRLKQVAQEYAAG
jgi:peptide deformylase